MTTETQSLDIATLTRKSVEELQDLISNIQASYQI